ncbi:hypothetical protein DCAR_0933417 [Daucus carota subsp. sativus]|uniref:Filament-like plant protein 7 n=1 Tax=Daucus carota subsp. sativus TaxID=79200 RepID=A0AAF0XVJ2_DAUCS|nr:PREDICTED: filament-like plant protein 7 [Daucus carota subsp. sativus]XP_017227218.1 PREDICTED: filament-like plant protein 7 [Daucus carota subsp. sativus]XP_017227219.1 PREDICTED: filament-like plant protein 7 [Daucus carota subsp. sativus]XP_017227220.1 PREDICTED: filament-like plant protein 7 [Daucus carota subsp. sativus]WOH13904.1 hypothetical protein DCAR_0933417 [Daucus carota subsp. sativus]
MDHKTWLWRKKPSEKTILATDKTDQNEEEKEVHLESLVKNLNETLTSVLRDSNTKDDLVAKHEKRAQDAIAGQKKAEMEAVFLKQELDEALLQNVSANETITYLTSALKESIQKIASAREDHEKSLHDAVMSTSREFEKVQKKLEDRFTETTKRLENLMVENSHLSEALLLKENMIQSLNRLKAQTETEFETLMARLDKMEKENGFLKYEFRILEKELEIRNEELEFNRRSADASHKQHLESMKKVSKLEAECQRLRVLMRKRLPGPAAFAEMRNEVEIHGRKHTETTRRNMNNATGLTIERSSETYGKNSSFLIGRLSIVEEENKILKELLIKKDDEIHSSRTSFSQTASKLSHVEAQLRDLLKDPKHVKKSMYGHSSNRSLSSSFDLAYDDELVHSRSLALISQEEAKSTPDCKMTGVSDMSLMDDFVEMEKLAIVAVHSPSGSSQVSSDVSKTFSNRLMSDSREHDLEISGKELVPVEPLVEISDACWPQDVLKVILDQKRISNKSLDELLEEIKVALSNKIRTSSKDFDQAALLPVSGYITWKTPTSSPLKDCLKKMSDIGILVDERESSRNEPKIVKAQDEDLEALLKVANEKNDKLMLQLAETEERIGSLQTELGTLKESKSIIAEQLEHQKLLNEDLHMQLTVSKLELDKLYEKLSYLEVELEERSRCCEEFEATCLELGLQLESVTNKDRTKKDLDPDKKLLQTDSEINAASAKLAECQETIFNLGKQLKALSSRKESSEFEKVVSTPNTTESKSKLNQRSSLRDMLDEHSGEPTTLESPKTKEIISTSEKKISSTIHYKNQDVLISPKVHFLGGKHEALTPVRTMAIIPSKKQEGSSLLKKLFLRRKRGTKVKRSLSFRT